MKDRQFTMLLGLVIAAGLVMGLIAFRLTGAPATAIAPAGAVNVAAPNDGQPHPSAADSEVASSNEPSNTVAISSETDTRNGEPTTPSQAPPEMQGPANGDPPGTAAQPPAQASAPPSTSLDSPPQ